MLRLNLLSTREVDFEARLARLLAYESAQDAAIEQAVAAILDDVRQRGDAAVLEYTQRFDGVDAASVADLELPRGARIRVATKYVKTAREHFAAKGMHVDLIKLYGSMELAPLCGLADAIVDLVSTGNTLKANDLEVVEDILPISARLIVNPAALKLKRGEVQPLLDALAKAVAARRVAASAAAGVAVGA